MIHLQNNTHDWDQALYRLPPRALVKLVDRVQTAPEVKAKAPDPVVLLRHVIDSGYSWSPDWATNVARARQEFATYIDGTFAQYAQYVDWVEEPWNEYVDDGMSAIQVAERVMWARACAYVWYTDYRPRWPWIKCAIGAQPVGNNIPLGFFRAAADYGAGISTHAYIKYNSLGVRDPLDFRYHSGRWHYDDVAARAAGIPAVPILITETGPYDGSTAGGWRSWNVCGGSIDRYVAGVRATLRDWKTTDAYKQKYRSGRRLIGFGLFTTFDQGWEWYQTNQPELNALADMYRSEGWAEPITEEPPVRTWEKLVYLLPQSATWAQYQAVAALAYPTRSEVAFSADSAFARPGNVTAHRVIVYDVAAWGGQAVLQTWVNAHYGYNPATAIEFRGWPASYAWPI